MGRMEQLREKISLSNKTPKEIQLEILKDEFLKLKYEIDKLGHYYLKTKLRLVELTILDLSKNEETIK